MNILQRDLQPKGGFQGVREHQLVMASRAFGDFRKAHAWEGIGNLIYLADARFAPNGETKMHSHREVDVISVMVEGRISHEGSLEHGEQLDVGDVQVQRAGREGFSHNEVNPDPSENRMIQLWVRPQILGGCAGYKVYSPHPSGTTQVYGGPATQGDTFDGKTVIRVVNLKAGDQHRLDGDVLVYVTRGILNLDNRSLTDGDLLRGEDMALEAIADSQFITIHELD